MANSPPIAPRVSDVQLLQVWRADASLKNQGDTEGKAPASRIEDEPPASPEAPAIAKLRIEIDALSGRFVQSLLDPTTHEVLAQYPSEDQLAFSRAISAYMKALSKGRL